MLTVSGVVGHPAEHSRSPLIHGYWLKQYGLRGAYIRFDVTPESLPEFLKNLREEGLSGCNITIPHKEKAFHLADMRDPVSIRLQAANTLWLDEQGRLCATNTDVHGFLANLDQRAPHWDWGRSRALVLGAGGAARSVIAGLLQRGFKHVVVANRTFARADALHIHFGRAVLAAGLGDVDRHVRDVDLIVNTTSLGMKGEGIIGLDFQAARPNTLVTDIVYIPLETPFLSEARRAGLATVDGLGMLLHQAIPGFARWFGIKPEVTEELRDYILRDLEQI